MEEPVRELCCHYLVTCVYNNVYYFEDCTIKNDVMCVTTSPGCERTRSRRKTVNVFFKMSFPVFLLIVSLKSTK